MAIGLKEKIKRAIDKRADDDKFLNAVYALIESYDKYIIGYDNNGKAIQHAALQEELEKASEYRKENEFFTSEQLKKKYSNWK
jgi:hypothetical protein